MSGKETSTETVKAATLGVAAVVLCCGAPFLILVGGVVVATVGRVDLGIGAAVAVLAAVVLLLAYRSLKGAGRTCDVASTSAGAISRKL